MSLTGLETGNNNRNKSPFDVPIQSVEMLIWKLTGFESNGIDAPKACKYLAVPSLSSVLCVLKQRRH